MVRGTRNTGPHPQTRITWSSTRLAILWVPRTNVIADSEYAQFGVGLGSAGSLKYYTTPTKNGLHKWQPVKGINKLTISIRRLLIRPRADYLAWMLIILVVLLLTSKYPTADYFLWCLYVVARIGKELTCTVRGSGVPYRRCNARDVARRSSRFTFGDPFAACGSTQLVVRQSSIGLISSASASVLIDMSWWVVKTLTFAVSLVSFCRLAQHILDLCS